MKLVVWNLNHRARRRNLPTWVGDAIGAQAPDAVVLTEYVEGQDHDAFVAQLGGIGLPHVSVSANGGGSNQVFIGTRSEHRVAPVPAPDPPIHPSVLPNILSVAVEAARLNLVGFRMPAYETDASRLKRQTWKWLLASLEPLASSAAIVAGDFNTAFGDGRAGCGDCLLELTGRGWRHAHPGEGSISFRSKTGGGRLIDHAFVSPSLAVARACCLWDFPACRPGAAGLPDHAMLTVEIAPR